MLGRVAVRPPQYASDAVRCAAVRPSDQPAGELSYWLLPRVEVDRSGTPRTLVVHVLPVAPQ